MLLVFGIRCIDCKNFKLKIEKSVFSALIYNVCVVSSLSPSTIDDEWCRSLGKSSDHCSYMLIEIFVCMQANSQKVKRQRNEI